MQNCKKSEYKRGCTSYFDYDGKMHIFKFRLAYFTNYIGICDFCRILEFLNVLLESATWQHDAAMRQNLATDGEFLPIASFA